MSDNLKAEQIKVRELPNPEDCQVLMRYLMQPTVLWDFKQDISCLKYMSCDLSITTMMFAAFFLARNKTF